MIDFFTDPYKDELIYSAIARYHFYSGNVDYKDTIEECFGKRSVVPILELAGRLDYLAGQLGGTYTSDKIIKDNTILPYYAPFMDKDRREDVINKMKSDGGISLYTEIGIVAGSVCKKNHIYYCPYCAKDEVEKYGEAYIHREHQLQGIILCPHHGCKLKKYQKGRLEASKVEYVRFVNDLIDFASENLDIDHFNKYLRLSKDAYYLLIHNLNKFDKDKMFDRYRYFLYEKGFIRDGGSVKQRELYEAFIDYYGEEFLQQLECSIDYDNEYNWLKVITRKSKRHSHPLRHLLLIEFLSDSIAYFFNADIHDINVNSQQHIYDISKCNISCMNQYKKNILNAIVDNPGIKRTMLRKQLKKEYIFLYRYDKKWLFSNLPNKTKPSNNYSENRVDWQARDKEYLKLLQRRYNELLSFKIPIRITKGSLAKVFGILPNLEKKLCMIPMTEKFLNEVCENVQQFQLRRCKYVVDTFIRSEEKVQLWRVQRIAGIRTKDFCSLKEEVLKYINENQGEDNGKDAT